MARRIVVLIAFVLLTAGASPAQSVDARSALEAAAKTMGGANLKTIRYSASGWSSRIGQTYGLAEDWPHYEVADYTRDRLRRQVVARGLHAQAGQVSASRQAADVRGARHVHSKWQLRLGHAG